MNELPPERQLNPGQETAHRQLAPAEFEPATSPFVDVHGAPEEITVFTDLPGCRTEDITVRTSNDSLLITAERPEEVEGEVRPLMHERPKRIQRSIHPPAKVDVEKAASFEDGVCKITLHKTEDARQQTIGVQ